MRTDFSHDFIVWESGKKLRFLRLRVMELPYGQKPCVSAIRVFGLGNGAKPDQVRAFSCSLEGKEPLTALDMQLAWEDNGAVGYNILWGYAPISVIRQIIWSRFRQFIWMCSQVQIAYWSG